MFLDDMMFKPLKSIFMNGCFYDNVLLLGVYQVAEKILLIKMNYLISLQKFYQKMNKCLNFQKKLYFKLLTIWDLLLNMNLEMLLMFLKHFIFLIL